MVENKDTTKIENRNISESLEFDNEADRFKCNLVQDGDFINIQIKKIELHSCFWENKLEIEELPKKDKKWNMYEKEEIL